MSTKKLTADLRLAHWAQVMRERTESGLNVKTYCERAGLHTNTYFYWQKKLREVASEQFMGSTGKSLQLTGAGFIEIKNESEINTEKAGLASQSDVVQIEINGARVSARSSYPVEKLVELLGGLMRK